jgi:hypothetical protein
VPAVSYSLAHRWPPAFESPELVKFLRAQEKQ